MTSTSGASPQPEQASRRQAHNADGTPAPLASSPGRAAVHTAGGHADDHPWPSAGHTGDLPRGEDEAGRVRAPCHQHPAGLVPDVVVAAEVAARIVAAHTAGTSLAALAARWHLTWREVARVVAIRQPHTGGMPVPPAATPGRVLP